MVNALKHLQTPVHLLRYFQSGKSYALDFAIDYLTDKEVLKVVSWPLPDEHIWALHINMTPLKKPQHQAYVPIAWRSAQKPTTSQAVECFRSGKGY